MLAAAWIVSLSFSLPQAFVYRTPEGKLYCAPNFAPKWGAKVSEKYALTSKCQWKYLI